MKRLAACAALLICAACAGKAPIPEPVIITKEVPVQVLVKCQDKRDPAPAYPDTDEAISATDDIFRLAQLYRAGRELRIARLAADEAQINACSE